MPWDKVMSKYKAGSLHSGSKSGPKVTSRKQAVAIMLSEKRAAEGGKAEYASKKARKSLKTESCRGELDRAPGQRPVRPQGDSWP